MGREEIPAIHIMNLALLIRGGESIKITENDNVTVITQDIHKGVKIVKGFTEIVCTTRTGRKRDRQNAYRTSVC